MYRFKKGDLVKVKEVVGTYRIGGSYIDRQGYRRYFVYNHNNFTYWEVNERDLRLVERP